MDKRQRHEAAEESDLDPPTPPVAPDGGIAPGYGIKPPGGAPKLTEETMVCLRGPCRHYWHMTTHFEAGNPADTWEALGLKAPRHHHHTCLVNPGMETEFEDDCVYECNLWDPMTSAEIKAREHRRDLWKERKLKEVDDTLKGVAEEIDDD